MKKAKLAKLAPLAGAVPSVLGPVPVVRVAGLRALENGEECMGIWRPQERDVRIEAETTAVGAWHTFWHEWAHIVFYDAGVRIEKALEEQICDALATARVREMLDNGESR